MPSWATVGEVAGPMGPKGETMPTTTSTTMAATKSGVSTFPMMSTTFDWRTVRANTTAKNTMEKGSSGTASPKMGVMVISNVVAAVRGLAMSTPVQSTAALFSSRPARCPSVPSMAALLPPARFKANSPKQVMITSISTKQPKAMGHWSPAVMPRYGGKMRFPAPKKMANSASPMTMKSVFLGCESVTIKLIDAPLVSFWPYSGANRLRPPLPRRMVSPL